MIWEDHCPSTPVVQQVTTTRANAQLRNVQPDLNLGQSYKALRRSKKHLDYPEDKSRHQHSGPLNTTPDPEANHIDLERQQLSPADAEISEHPGAAPQVGVAGSEPGPVVSDLNISGKVETIKLLFIERTEGYLIPEFEKVFEGSF